MSEKRTSIAEPVVDSSINLHGVLCPLNFVKTKLLLEEMEDGQILEVLLDDGEPIRNVPRSLKAEGHKIVGVQRLEDDMYRLLVRRGTL